MTTAQLIALLKDLPDNTPVYSASWYYNEKGLIDATVSVFHKDGPDSREFVTIDGNDFWHGTGN